MYDDRFIMVIYCTSYFNHFDDLGDTATTTVGAWLDPILWKQLWHNENITFTQVKLEPTIISNPSWFVPTELKTVQRLAWKLQRAVGSILISVKVLLINNKNLIGVYCSTIDSKSWTQLIKCFLHLFFHFNLAIDALFFFKCALIKTNESPS